MLTAGDADSAFAYTYDAANRLTQVDNNGTPSVPRVILTVGYDNLDRRTSLSASVAGTADFLNGYSYDALGRMTQVTQQGQSGGNTVAAKRVDLSYNAAGNFAGISRYANLAGTQLVVSTTYGYDNDNRLTSLSHDKGGTNLASYTWSFDNAGRLTATTNADGSTSYTYDAASQLTAADHSYQTDEAYSYDANGNRTTSGYSTGTNNRVTSDGTYNYTYDSEGNRTRKTTISTGAYVDYTWDYHNRLTDVTFKTSGGTTTKKVHYTYDVFDRLLGKQVDSNGDGTYDSAQWFVSHGEDTLLAYDGAGSLTNRYLTGPVIDQVFADERASGVLYWSLADNLGTVRDVAQYNSGTNTTTVVDHLKYDSFGQITAQSDSSKQPLFAYTGRQWDSDTNLQYSRARWYDPRIGRFLSQDPISFAAGDVNLTRYVSNRPVDFTDPSGLAEDGLDGSALPGGGCNPLNWPGQVIVFPFFKKFVFDNYYANYGDEQKIRAIMAEREIKLQTVDNVLNDASRAKLRSDNERPIGECYNGLIKELEYTTAGMYGNRPGGITKPGATMSVSKAPVAQAKSVGPKATIDDLATNAADAYVRGARKGGVFATEADIKIVNELMEKHNTVYSLYTNDLAARELSAAKANGIFRPYRDGSASLFMKPDMTRFELLHEIEHLKHWAGLVDKLGKEAAYEEWKRLGLFAREKHVYEAMQKLPDWTTFTEAERQFAHDYMADLAMKNSVK